MEKIITEKLFECIRDEEDLPRYSTLFECEELKFAIARRVDLGQERRGATVASLTNIGTRGINRGRGYT